MTFEPDILVTNDDGSEIMLVAETKLHEKDVPNAENQLKAYMTAMGSPIGLLITPAFLRIYRDRYINPRDQSIETVGRFDVSSLFASRLREAGPNAAFIFESYVQSWLELLASKPLGNEFPTEFKRAAEANILPALSQGIIRAGHPRSALSA